MWCHLLLIVAVSSGYEALFLYDPPNPIDEGWPLYAAQRLHAGGTLYDDVFFVFPPGHLLPAWVAFGLDPPGLSLTRAIYAAFSVALCAGLYLLGRRLMPAGFALLGALFLAVATPTAHENQHLFGYRYLVFSVLALLCLARHLDDRDGAGRRWLALAGVCTGVAFCFRVTPAAAVSAAVGAATLAAGGTWRRWLPEWGVFAAALLVTAAPVAFWIAGNTGVASLWREMVARPALMVELQSLPLPALALPSADRRGISASFVALQFRLYLLLYLGYGVALARGWCRGRRAGDPFKDALLLAVVTWGGLFYLRVFGRSDEAHLASALPPVCLLLAHLASRGLAGVGAPVARAAACVGFAGLWVFLWHSDRPLAPLFRETPSASGLPSAAEPDFAEKRRRFLEQEARFRANQARNASRVVVLDLSAQPMLYVKTGWTGPGYFDVMMPGTFLDEEEETRFLQQLRRSKPVGVFWPERPFDDTPERAVEVVAPRVVQWARSLSSPPIDRDAEP